MSTTYDVIVKFSTTGSLDASIGGAASKSRSMEGSLNRSQGAMSAIGESARTVGSRFAAAGGVVADAFTGTVEKALGVVESIGKAGAVAAMGALAYGVVGVNNQLEKTKISLAAIFSANGVSNFSNGMVIAADQMAKMRSDAARLPGETKDLVQIFKMAAVPAFKAGASVDQVRNIAGLAMAAGATMDLPMDQVARETAMMLQGRGGAHNILAMDMGIDGHALHEASPEERMKIVTAALGKFAPALAAFETSWDGITSTFKDGATRLLGTATQPLFERIKTLFSDGNTFLSANADKLNEMAQIVGGKLATAFDYAVDKIRSWYPAIAAFATNASDRIAGIWKSAEPMIDKISAKAQGILGSDSAIDKIGGILKLYAAVKVGGPMLGGIAEAGGDVLGGGMKLAGALGGGGGMAAMLGAMLNPAALAAALGGVIAVFGALAVGAMAVYGAVHALTDSTSVFHQTAVQLWERIRVQGSQALEAISQAADALAPAATFAADALGSNLLSALSSLGAVAMSQANIILSSANMIGGALQAIGIGGNGTEAKGNGSSEFSGFNAADLANSVASGTTKGMKAGGGGGGGGTNMTVNITVNQNDDPSRVARSVVDKLIEAKRNPRSSPYTPDYSSARRP